MAGKSLGAAAIEALLRSYLQAGTAVPEGLCARLDEYLELLLRWNARTNLSAIRAPEEIVRRHFGESLFAARHLGECATLLDFGSGAGFPGLPIQLLRPEIQVTLAESQNKKAAFLREAVRTLGLATEVWAARVEAMPTERRFDVVTLRAVDQMEAAIKAAAPRATRGVLLMTTSVYPAAEVAGFAALPAVEVPGGDLRQVVFLKRAE
jgi:16S rRNA (guanine527-N7)-methyltransferase